MTRRATLLRLFTTLCLCFATTQAVPYSILTHEALIDLAWKQSIRPILLQRYPNLTEAQLQEAHAYAYGGCAIQDFGYYPFGNRFFSELTHYVRSGDFVLSLLRNAQSPDDLAFAIGSLSHYIGDTIGHSDATNRAVPLEFPKLEHRYGQLVNYAEDPNAHVQTEFAFDIDQLSKRRLAPAAYRRFVGLEVPRKLLRTAFYETYGLDLPDIIGTKQTSLRVYRFAVRRFLPDIARSEVILHRNSFPPDPSGPAFDAMTKDLIQASTDNNWEAYRHPPGFGSHMLAGVIFVIPKFGPIRMLAIRGPQPQTEAFYIDSVNRSIRALRLVLTNYDRIGHYISNRDLDTGLPVKPGSYPLTDSTYAELLARLTAHADYPVPFQIKHDIQAYYADPNAPITTKQHPKQWAAVQANLQILATMHTVGVEDAIPDEIFDPE
jgi:hypothetical protein